MLGYLTRRKEERAQRGAKQALEERTTEVQEAFTQGLARIKTEGIDYAVLELKMVEPNPQSGALVRLDQLNRYYDDETLAPAELKLAEQRQSYGRTALRAYPDEGVEILQRNAISVLLPTTEKFYLTEGATYLLCREVFRFLAEKGWTADKVEQAVTQGIEEYKQIPRLMEEASLHQKLGEMERRTCSPLEQIFEEMRDNIKEAK